MNRKSIKERAKILHCLVEGNSIRSTSRLTGASKTTITKLLVDVGKFCASYQYMHLIDLPCSRLQVDEIWSFVYAKQKNVTKGMKREAGNVWIWVALCPDTKLVPTWFVGTRGINSARSFIKDIPHRLKNRIQLSSDGYKAYIDAVDDAFGTEVDFAMIVKDFNNPLKQNKKRKKSTGISKRRIMGSPKKRHISTCLVERQNLTMRMGIRRLTRKTNGFSKKIENHYHAINLHFMYYNFIRIHQTLRVTPAMASGVTDKLWSLEDLVQLVEDGFETNNCSMKHLKNFQL